MRFTWLHKRAKAMAIAAALLVLASAGAHSEGAELVATAYPRLANIYLHGFADLHNVEALARWDLLVLSTAWSETDLARLRALNPSIRLLLYVSPYAVRWPAPTGDAWASVNAEYAANNDLWWYDHKHEPASDWPGSRMVNITAVGGHGPHGTWPTFIRDRIVELVETRPSIDGVMLDNLWQRLSWNQARLNLDSDCNPTHNPSGCDGAADADSALDAMWNEALAGLVAELRERFDASEAQRQRALVLVGNGATDYHEWIHGRVHEHFPSGWSAADYGNPYGYNWNVEMFEADGGYLTAPFLGVPQRVHVMNAIFAGTTTQPSRSDEFERHKRFTLVSTLLGDGYYSLDADARGGHGALWWEPEFDQAGRGKGYLGQALGSMRRLIEATGAQRVRNGDFSNQLHEWAWHPTGADAAVSVDTHEFSSAPAAARLDVRGILTAGGELKAWHGDLALRQDEAHTLELWTRSDRDVRLVVELYSEDCPRNVCLRSQALRVRDEWTEHVVSFVAPATTRASLNLYARQPGSVWVDDISLRSGSSNVFRRDFENGIVLLNYTNEPHTLALEAPFARLDIPGSSVFDGAVVEHETVPAWDARILLRKTRRPHPAQPRGRLYPNRPNPFNPGTRIRFALEEAQHVRVAVYDLRGRLVRDLFRGELPAGLHHSVVWNGTDHRGRPVHTGMYVYTLTGAGFTRAHKMTLLR